MADNSAKASEEFSRGSEWRKWDLHVHSPASFEWGGTKKLGEMSVNERKTAFDKMVASINGSDCAAFGIMDYWTFDGYLGLKNHAKQQGLTLNKTVFPGIELRVEAPVDFRLNIHVLFEESISETTLAEFKARLHLLDNGQRSLSDDAIADFGKRLDGGKAAHHGVQDGLHKTDAPTALRLGMMTAKITRQSLVDAVKYLGKERCVVILPYDCSDGVEGLDWKKHGADDLFFLRFADIFETRDEDCIKLFLGKRTVKNDAYFEAFQEAIGGKPKPIVSGSDAHRFEDYGKSPGEKFTWLKANPTFLGLRQTLVEPANRVFVGRVPAKVSMVASHKTKYIRSLEIKKSAGSTISEKWFDNKLALNSELVAVIGNKGGGKSALADIIGMLGNSSKHESFSFLNVNKFKHKKTGRADKFEAVVEWESGKKDSKRLDAGCMPSEVESVRYIPQSYLEKVCNEGDRHRPQDVCVCRCGCRVVRTARTRSQGAARTGRWLSKATR